MKTPRIKDFDPDQPVPELGSPLAGMPAIKPSATPADDPIGQTFPPVTSTAPSPENRPYALPPVRPPGRRTITRYAFEFFQDQIESIRGFSLEEKARGEKGSMSEMVREAVDAYIAKRRRIDK